MNNSSWSTHRSGKLWLSERVGNMWNNMGLQEVVVRASSETRFHNDPTGIDHKFAIWGFYMLSPEEEVIPKLKIDPSFGGLLPRNIPMPIQLKLKAGETKKIQVALRGLTGEKNLGARYPFFCPKHKDIRISGYVYVD